MTVANVNIGNLANAIMKELEEYANTTADELKAAAKEIGKETAKELQKTSPKASGVYAKDWTSSVQSEKSNSISVIVHDKKYQITHLLEKGHQNRNGGRTPAIVHIAPAEEAAVDQLEKELRKRL
ncbi:HK97 gp10 family phage protein [Blautia pseudococcoides]|nr:HK97 gp10 family phage protein [Blautia pseudococcoides]